MSYEHSMSFTQLQHNCILLSLPQVMTISPNTEFLFSHNLLCWLMKSQALATTLASWTTGSCCDNNGINLCRISKTKSVHTAQLFINAHSCLYSWWQLLIFLKYTHKRLKISHLLHEILVLLHPTSPRLLEGFLGYTWQHSTSTIRCESFPDFQNPLHILVWLQHLTAPWLFPLSWLLFEVRERHRIIFAISPFASFLTYTNQEKGYNLDLAIKDSIHTRISLNGFHFSALLSSRLFTVHLMEGRHSLGNHPSLL